MARRSSSSTQMVQVEREKVKSFESKIDKFICIAMGYYYYFRCQKTKQYNQRLWATVTSNYQKSRQTLHFQRMRVVGRSQKRVKPQSLPNKDRNKSKRAIALPAPNPQSSRVRKQIVQSSCQAASIRATVPGCFVKRKVVMRSKFALGAQLGYHIL